MKLSIFGLLPVILAVAAMPVVRPQFGQLDARGAEPDVGADANKVVDDLSRSADGLGQNAVETTKSVVDNNVVGLAGHEVETAKAISDSAQGLAQNLAGKLSKATGKRNVAT